MKSISVMDNILSRFSSIDIVIEPEESAVREAVNKLKGSDPKYFDGVKKIVVEHGSPKSPYLGKSTGDGIVYVSLDAIKNQLDSQGLKDDRLAFVNEVLKTLGHEVAHIRGDMQPTESPSEIEEHKLDQQFPTPSLEKSAADLSEQQKRTLQLQKEIRDLQEKLSHIQVVWKQLSQSKTAVTPDREAHFKSEQDKLNAEIASKRAEIDGLRDTPAAETSVKPSIPTSQGPASTPAATEPQQVDEVARYKPILEQISSSLTAALVGFGKLQSVLSSAPDFVKGEVGVLNSLRKNISELDILNKKISSRVQIGSTAPHLFKAKALELLFESAREILLANQEMLTSDEDFIRPLTNGGLEGEFYNGGIAPVVGSILSSLSAAASQVGLQHKELMQVPDKAPASGTAEERKSKSPGVTTPAKTVKTHSERDLPTIRQDFTVELQDLFAKRDALRRLHLDTAGIKDPKEFSSLMSERDALEAQLVSAEEERVDWLFRKRTVTTPAARSEWAQEGVRIDDAIKSINTQLASISEKLAPMQKDISAAMRDPSYKDKLVEAIHPYTGEDALFKRIDLVSKKLEKFKNLDSVLERQSQLQEQVASLNKAPTKDAAAIKAATDELEKINTQISELRQDLGVTSSPRPRKSDPDRDRVRDLIDSNVESIKSPLFRTIFEGVIPAVSSGGALKSKKMDLERKLRYRTEDVAPETDYDGLKGVVPADVEISTWQSRVKDIDREIGFRRSDQMLDFTGRIGQAAEALLAKMLGDETAVVPQDILGPGLTLKNYSGSAGNDKIIRDLESALAVNRKAAEELKKEFDAVDTQIDAARQAWDKAKYDKLPNIDQLKDNLDRLITKRKMLTGSQEYKKLRNDLAVTVDRLVQHAVPETIETPISRRVVKEREQSFRKETPERLREQRQISREMGGRSDPEVEFAQRVAPNEATGFGEIDESGRVSREPVWTGQKWRQPDPEGRANLAESTRSDIELGLFDPKFIPQDVRRGLISRLQKASSELREFKGRLTQPDLTPAAKERIMQRITEVRSEINKIRELLKDPTAYTTDVKELETQLEAQLEFQDRLTAKIYEMTGERESLVEALDSASDAEKPALQKRLDEVNSYLEKAPDGEAATVKRISDIEQRLKAERQKQQGLAPGESGEWRSEERAPASEGAKELKDKRREDSEGERASLRARISDKEFELANLRAEADRLGKDVSSDLLAKIKAVSVEIDTMKNRLSGVRMYTPSEGDKEKARKHRTKYEKAVEIGDAERDAKYRAADRQERVAMERRRGLVDPLNPMKQLPSTKLLNAARGLAYAHAKALELNPRKDTSRETRVRDLLYQLIAVENSIRMMDDKFLEDATSKAAESSQDPMQQYKTRNKYLDEMLSSAEYTGAQERLKSVMAQLDQASVIEAPTGRGALEAVVEDKDYGAGVGKVRSIPQKWVGQKDPYMLFMRAAWDARVALMRYKEAAQARKRIDKKIAAEREALTEQGLSDADMQTALSAIDEKYKLLIASNVAHQLDEIEQFDQIVDKMDGAVRGTEPTVYFNPSSVEKYLDEYKNSQAELVKQKELLRRYIQVTEIGSVTSNIYDPDRFMKTMAKEFSDEMPTVSKWQQMVTDGDPAYRDLAYVAKHLLWGQKSKARKTKGGGGKPEVIPAEIGDPSQSLVTENIRHKLFPAPVRPGGKGQRGQKIPQFMQTRSRK